MAIVNAYAAQKIAGELSAFQYKLGALAPDEVEIEVHYCGICHSDLSMLDNDWGFTQYPFVPGHEIVGKVIAKGDFVTHIEIGQSVGVGWHAHSCMTCEECTSGNHNLCSSAVGTITGRYGGFADKIRVQSIWAIPIPEEVPLASAGPLFCGGITVFNPLVQFGISPLSQVGVVGIGGLGHMALSFLRFWGCEVTAFSTSADKEAEARSLGAHHFVNTRDKASLKKLKSSFDLILVTVNVSLDWDLYLQALKPKGRLHIVGALPNVGSSGFGLIGGQKTISGSPVGSPYVIGQMLKFAKRHQITPMIEMFKLSEVNEALEKLRNGSPRYRIVLDAKQ